MTPFPGELWRRHSAIGYPSDIINCLRSLFDYNSAQLAIKQKRSSSLAEIDSVNRGYLQESAYFPS